MFSLLIYTDLTKADLHIFEAFSLHHRRRVLNTRQAASPRMKARAWIEKLFVDAFLRISSPKPHSALFHTF